MPWSDLMLTMFVLFVSLYLLERGAAEPLPAPRPAPAREVPAPSPNRLGDAFAVPGFEVGPGGWPRLVLLGDLLFESGSAELRPVALPLLEGVAEAIRSAPRHLRAIHVAGHSDDLPVRGGRFPSNWELSSARASAVVRVLVDAFALEASRFVVSGHAEHRPRDRSGAALARARNRRVEIVLTDAAGGVVRAL